MSHFFDRYAVVILALVAAPVLGQMPARGDGISTLYGTGQGLPTGVADPNFTIVSAPSGATVNPGGATDTIPPVTSPAYAAAPAGTRWIGPNPDNSVQQPTGNYDFRTTFSLAGLDAATAQITGVVAADNKVADIKLNGVELLGISGGSLSNFLDYKITSGFSSGINTLDFIVNNDSTGGPAALVVSESGTASVPEPSTLAVFGFAAAFAAIYLRRMKVRAG